MQYEQFRDAVEKHLRSHPEGATWRVLKDELRLPYEIPCPSWTHRLEEEIGLRRVPGERGKVWVVRARPGPTPSKTPGATPGSGRRRSAEQRKGSSPRSDRRARRD